MNYILMRPQIKNELTDKFTEYNNILDRKLTFKEFLQNTFNNNNRGILYNKVSDSPLKIKIWAPHSYMVIQELRNKKAFEIVYLKDTTSEKFNSMLQYYKVLKGQWDFDLISADVISDGDYDYLREEESYNEKREEFDNFNKYWLNYDLITQKREEKSKEQQKLSLTEYTSISINFDKENAILRISTTEYSYKKGDRIRISTTKPMDSYRGQTIMGEIEEYRKLSKQIVVKFKTIEILNDLHNNNNYKKGFIYVDDIGTMIMLRRQKEALKKLFNRDTSNKRLKDFIPNIENANTMKSLFNSEIDFNDSLNKMNQFQINSVKGALDCSDIYLIQGPPGTGKTTVICEIIKQITKLNGDVLVSSQNHLAVDNVLQRIGDEQNIRAIRIGDEEKIELGCDKYLLNNRVQNIQHEIQKNIKNFKSENEVVYDEIENIEKLVISYENSKEKVVLLNNLIINFYEHNKVKEELTKELEKKQNEKESLEEEINKLGGILAGKESIFIKLSGALKEYGLPLDEVNIIGEKLSNITISPDEINIINTYADIVEVLESEILEHKKIKEQKTIIISEMKEIEENYEKLRESIISLGYQYEETSSTWVRCEIRNKIEMMTEDLQGLKDDYREKEFDVKAIDYKIKEQLDIVYKWSDKANEYKELVEELLIRNSHICSKKTEFVNIVNLKKYLLKKFDGNEECFKYIKYLNKYKRVDELTKKIDSIKSLVLDIEKQINRETKMLSNISNKIDEYSDLEDIKYILESENISVYDFNSSIIEKLKNLDHKHKQLKRKKELIESTNDIREQFASDLENYQNGFEDMYIGVSNVVCATCSGIAGASNNYFMEKEFEYVIIDEAAKCFSSELLIPMIRGKKIILVGDHKQLSPIIEKDILLEMEAEEHVTQDEKQLYYNNSLFGIMFDTADNKIKTTLKKQYRMNNDVSAFISSEFYNKELMDGQNIIDINHGIRNLSRGLYWINSGLKEEGLEKISGNSYYNELETEIIIELLIWLDRNTSVKKEIGIISPYKAQTQYLLERISGIEFENLALEINTIDAFQGREKQIIIMNCVRNNENGEFGHVSGNARVNVAVSRAQELLIVIGNEQFIKKNRGRAKSLYDLLKYTEEERCKLSREFFIKDNVEERI